MNKKVYIGKYDYMRYFSRCKSTLFLKNAEIEEIIKQSLKKVKALQDDLDDESEEYDEDNVDSYASYREMLEQGIDLSTLNVNKNLEIDPKILEGQIIDKAAKSYLLKHFQIEQFIDYDESKYKYIQFDNEAAAYQTKLDYLKLLEHNKEFIMFQPTFVCQNWQDNYLVTKCDCLVHKNNQNILVEVKGTTSSKIIHLLDLFFQNEVIKENDYLTIDQHMLCLVAYCRAKKNTVPFVLSKYINLNKTSVQINPKLKQELSSLELIDKKQEIKKGKDHLVITKLLNGDLSEDDEDILETLTDDTKNPEKKIANIVQKANDKLEIISEEFDNIISELTDLKQNKQQNVACLKPCKECKLSAYKTCDYWLKCRELFNLEYKKKLDNNLKPFVFSGKVIKFEDQLLSYESKQFDISFLCKKDAYKNLFHDQDSFNKPEILTLWNKLQSRSNRVYFDFESLNTAIRPMDDVFPFNQVLTQNSIIKTKNFYDEYYWNNMIVDPINIDQNWLKAIVDNLYEEDLNTWYIVYNKNFECTRLKEIKELLNDPVYSKKIDQINANIFDLADFFDPTSSEKTQFKILLNDLHGYYSIKKVLRLIPQNILLDTKTVSYDSLEVHNGADAQFVTTKRFFNQLSDTDWKTYEINLQKYCENDVRAMIAVEKFIKKILIDNNII